MEWIVVLLIFLSSALWVFLSERAYKKTVIKKRPKNKMVEKTPCKNKSPKQVHRVCVFCGGSPLSKEHLWSDWIKHVVPRTGPNSHFHYLTSIDFLNNDVVSNEDVVSDDPDLMVVIPGIKQYQGHFGNRTIKEVCTSCNGGWMSRIEEKAKDILTPLILGQPVIIDKESQLTIAKWAVLKTIIGEYTDPPTQAIPKEDRKVFMQTEIPPNGWKVFIARYSGKEWKHRYFHMGSRMLNKATLSPVPLQGKMNVQFSIFALENLVIYTTRTTLERIELINHQEIAYKLIKVYPRVNSSIDWAKAIVLGDDDLNILREPFTSGNTIIRSE
jgi:hypothetical protein